MFAAIAFVATGTNYPETEPALVVISLIVGASAQWHYLEKEEDTGTKPTW